MRRTPQSVWPESGMETLKGSPANFRTLFLLFSIGLPNTLTQKRPSCTPIDTPPAPSLPPTLPQGTQ